MEFTIKEVSVYQYYMKASEDCAHNARVAVENKDFDMFTFWSNASREFERRARNV